MSNLLKLFFLMMLGLHNIVVANTQNEKAKANISAELSSLIIHNKNFRSPKSFDSFLLQLTRSNLPQQQDLSLTIKNYQANQTLSQSEMHQIQRLLGIYTRLKYGHEAMQALAKLVAIPTFRVEGVEQHDNPQFDKMANALASMAEEFNLRFRNIDKRVYEISIKGSSKEVVGIHAHADVVPVNPSLWVLEDGTKLDPFQLTTIGDRMYGRGTEDDKNGIVVTMFAMKVIQEENIPLLRNFHLLIDTTEETTSDAIPYYFSRYPTPNYNLALDGSYPVIIAEKGFAGIVASFPVRSSMKTSQSQAEITSITGGLAINQIPAASVATINTSDAYALMKSLNQLGAKFVAKHGSNFSINATIELNAVKLTVKGVSAHSSEPESGVNPVSRMFAFIDQVQKQANIFTPNHITDAANYVVSNWGLDYLGKTLGIDFSDAFMGPLTSAVTLVSMDQSNLNVGVNLRIPIGRKTELLEQYIKNKLADWNSHTGLAVDFKIYMGKPMYRNPKGQWVNALLDVATENLNMPRKFGSSAGGTSVHNLPNGVQFGLAMPNKKYTGHNANEFKEVEQFLLDLQIVTEMIARIGQIPSLE